ncbi:MAG TPA: Gldg family protein [Gemmataceae bacterium]|nr:Gldg family protein [Gemmataceae bacterium]
MSSNPSPTNPPAAAGDFYEKLAAKQQNIAYVLIAVGLALLAIPLSNAVLYRWQSLAVFIWGAALSVCVAGVGLWNLLVPVRGGPREQADRLRETVLFVLAGVGLLTALLGLLLPFSSPPFSLTNYPDIFAGGVRKWRERDNALAVTRLVAALLGGLILMFLGLTQARTFERTSPNLRRLLYGYNAILTTLLLLLIAGLINLLPYSGVQPFSYANEAVDWTRTGIHTLNPATKNVLAELKQPVKVYVLGSTSDRVAFEMEDLLEKCRAVNPQLSWERLSRDRNPGAVVELMQEFQIPESEGVLVVYGTKPNTIHDFIKSNDLFEQKFGEDPGRRFVFKGENALLNSLTFLSSNKSKAVVYFTQGSGELDFKQRQADRIDVGIGALIDDLNRVNYQARELTVAPDTDKIPDDADIIVVARPREEMPTKFVTALRDYLNGANRKENKKGKLMVLFDVVQRGGTGPMVHTGLEALVAGYGVRVSDDRVINPLGGEREPLRLTAYTNPASKNPIAQAFSNETEGSIPFLFYSARTVTPAAANPGQPAPSPAETLVIADPRFYYLIDTDLNASPTGLIKELNQLAQKDPQQVRNRLKTQPSLAVTVTEGKTLAPFPGHEFQAKEGQPRMIVFGDATWVSNRLEQQVAPFHFNLFVSCLSWLAERADIGTRVPPAERDLYRLKTPPDSSGRLLLLPGALMVLAVLALGMGVWVVRRR